MAVVTGLLTPHVSSATSERPANQPVTKLPKNIINAKKFTEIYIKYNIILLSHIILINRPVCVRYFVDISRL